MQERFSVSPTSLNFTVVRLESGSLMLYAPARIRDEFDFSSWLDSLGTVEWIVVASSYHTLFLPSVLARYPEAKVIGAPQAEDKLKHVGALIRNKFDFNSTSEEELAHANRLLEEEGVQVYLVKGDTYSNSLAVLAHGVLLTCDLVTGRHDGGIANITNEEFQEYKEEHAAQRLFKYLHCNKPNSPNGFLPHYR